MSIDFAARLRQESAAPTQDFSVDFAEQLRRQDEESRIRQEAAQQVTNDMGPLKRAFVGFGRGLTLAGRGIGQLALQAGGALGMDTQPTLDAMAANEADEKQIFDAGVGKTLPGMAGSLVGETLPYFAVPAGGLARGAGLASKVVQGAKLGGIAGGLQYVDEGESRLGNTLQGAALGGIAGGALDVAARGGAKVANAITGRMSQPAADVAALGRQYHVPVYAPDVAQSPIMSKIGTIAEDVPLVGMAKPRLQQAEAAGTAAQALTSRLATPVSDVGRELQGSLTRRSEVLQKAAGAAYDRVAKVADPLGDVPLNKMRTTAKQLLDAAKKDIDPDAALIARLNRIAGASDAPAFSQARQFRSNLGDEIKKLQTATDLKSARPLQQLKAALEQDMNTFAQNAGGDVAAKWKRADAFFRQRVVPQRESDLVRAMRNRNPDEVFQQFIRSGTQDRAQRLYNALDHKGRNAVKSGILQQAMDKATQSGAGARGVAFSPAKFAGELERVQGSVGVFFKGADKKEVDGFVKLMRHIERAGQVAENPPTGNRLILPMLMGETLAPGTAATTLGSGALARTLFTTPAGKRLLLASNRFPPGHPSIEEALGRFRNITVAKLAMQDGQY